MTTPAKPLTAYEVAAIETWAASYFSPPFQHMTHGYFLRLIATIEQQAEQIEKLREALSGTVEAITRYTQEHCGISGYTGARLVDAREALAATEPVNDKR